MGEIIVNHSMDDARAKKLGRSIQKRLNDLGNQVSYSHSLEVVAEAFGFANWQTMQAALHNKTAGSAPSNSSELHNISHAFPFENGLKCFGVVGKGMPTRAVFNAVSKAFLSNNKGKRITPYVIDIYDRKSKVHADSHGITNGSLNHWTFKPGQPGARMNIFDLLPGERGENPGWTRGNLWSFLQVLLLDANDFKTGQVLGEVLSSLLERFCDANAKEATVREYVRGYNAVVDKATPEDFSGTWWQLSDMLRAEGNAVAARIAEYHAAPRFSDFIVELETIDPKVFTMGGRRNMPEARAFQEKVLNKSREILRVCPFFDDVTSIEFSTADSFTCLIDGEQSERSLSLTYMYALHMTSVHWYEKLIRMTNKNATHGTKTDRAIIAEHPHLPPMATFLRDFSQGLGDHDKARVFSMLEGRVAPIYRRVSEAQAFVIEADSVDCLPFDLAPHRRAMLLTGTDCETREAENLAVVKKLDLGVDALRILSERLPHNANGNVGGLLVEPEGKTSFALISM